MGQADISVVLLLKNIYTDHDVPQVCTDRVCPPHVLHVLLFRNYTPVPSFLKASTSWIVFWTPTQASYVSVSALDLELMYGARESPRCQGTLGSSLCFHFQRLVFWQNKLSMFCRSQPLGIIASITAPATRVGCNNHVSLWWSIFYQVCAFFFYGLVLITILRSRQICQRYSRGYAFRFSMQTMT